MDRGTPVVAAIAILLCAACASGPPTFDRAYAAALRFGETPERGVVLFLHGCAGLVGPQLDAWQTGWVRYLTTRGFVVVAPDSFADVRPRWSCGAPEAQKQEIYRIRAQQARHALERIRAAHPGTKIVVWGHSEGGGVANLLDAGIDGVVTTGYQCGFQNTRRTSIPDHVPLLVIMGGQDHWMNAPLRATGSKSLQELCGVAAPSARREYRIVEGMGHSAPLEQPLVQQAVDRFLDGLR